MVYRPIQLVSLTSINFRDVLLACFSSDSHQLTASGALSGDAPRYHRTRRTAHSDGRVLKWHRRLDSASTHSRDQGPRVVCPALPPSRNRLGQRALRNLLGVLARRARKDALELRLHQRLSGRVVPDEGGNQCSSMVISGTCRLASYRRHVLNEPHRRAATCGLNLSSASTCESVLIGALRGRQ